MNVLLEILGPSIHLTRLQTKNKSSWQQRSPKKVQTTPTSREWDSEPCHTVLTAQEWPEEYGKEG